MTNYKKPAFWIVVAAVALCIVVAVCFLARPREYGPTVGNPQMLEVPGVEWLATPDEVKEALNITDEQIFKETKSSGFVLEMGVTDLTLYGRDVVYAKFNFWFGSDGDTELQEVLLYFSENTDMRKLEKELLEIYGPGKSKSDIHSLYENSINRVKRTEPYMFQIEENAQNDLSYVIQDGNPFQDALDDPDYMLKHWVTENGLSILPEEVVEYFKSVEDDEIPKDEDALMEMLDQIPWVSITMSNRNATTIFCNALGRPNELYTNNYMRFDAKLLAEYIHASTE